MMIRCALRHVAICPQHLARNGVKMPGILIGSVVKYLFYKEWFSVMQLFAQDGNHLGYYAEVDTPIRKLNGEYHLTDLFLNLWIAPDGKFIELDRDEFEEGFRKCLLTSYQYKKPIRFSKY